MYQNGATAGLAFEYSDPQAIGATVDRDKLQEIAQQLLIAIGENPNRPGLIDTPRRFADWWKEFIDYHPGKTETVFASNTVGQLVVVSGMRVWSLCEHHLLPFYCDLSVGYVISDEVIGLSKIGRIAHQFAHRLQLQEQLTKQVGEEIRRITKSQDVAVIAHGQHLCMTMRGIQTPAIMSSSMMTGRFETDSNLRTLFLQMAQQKPAW